jgi:hypothetical protein
VINGIVQNNRNIRNILKREGDAYMKRFSSLTLVLMTTLIISACGAQQATPLPTVNVVDMQNTMAASAFTMVAETQAAIPTATPTTPPTDTPIPTVTLPPLPTLGATFTAVPNATSGAGDPCINQVLPDSLQGDPVRMRIDNSTTATVALSVYLNSTTPQGQCGYRSYTLPPGEFVVINNLIEGCYTIWAWNPDPDEYFIVTNGTSCIDSSDTWVFNISTGSITLGT